MEGLWAGVKELLEEWVVGWGWIDGFQIGMVCCTCISLYVAHVCIIITIIYSNFLTSFNVSHKKGLPYDNYVCFSLSTSFQFACASPGTIS
jgi:hypothetical protein